jgi:hypothetical protein
MGEYQVMDMEFRYSSELFDRVTTRRTTDAIARVRAIVAQIEAERRITDPSLITKGIMEQMLRLVQDLQRVPLPDDLAQALSDLRSPIAHAIAAAGDGDQLDTTRDAARLVHDRIVALYPMFDAIRASDAAFNMVINIHGLNEFYAEWTHIR